VDYKIATKIIANRLAKVLPDIICPNQTGYAKNRYIGENVRGVRQKERGWDFQLWMSPHRLGTAN